MNREAVLRGRIRSLTWFFIFGLVVSGATAIPLEWELNLMAHSLGISDGPVTAEATGLGAWIGRLRDALHTTYAAYPFMAYGTDWLAFGHFAIAISFVGALRDPVRNVWVFTFGMIACALIVPYAFVLGDVRGIPVYWRLIDCSFGIFGIIPVWLCRKWVREIERATSVR